MFVNIIIKHATNLCYFEIIFILVTSVCMENVNENVLIAPFKTLINYIIIVHNYMIEMSISVCAWNHGV